MKLFIFFLFLIPHLTKSATCYNGTCDLCLRSSSGCGWCEDAQTASGDRIYGSCLENQSSCTGFWSTKFTTCPQHCVDSPYESSLCAVPDRHDLTAPGYVYQCAVYNGLEGKFPTTQTDTSPLSRNWNRWKNPFCDFDTPACARAFFAYSCAWRCKPCGRTSAPCTSMCQDISNECSAYLNCSGWDPDIHLTCFNVSNCVPGGVGPNFDAWMKAGFPFDWDPSTTSSSSSSSKPHRHILLSSGGITGTVFWFLFVFFPFF